MGVEMSIGGRMVGQDYSPLVIAEIGINHGGDVAVARKMIEIAAKSGAECVKHQMHIIEDEMTEEAKHIFPPNSNMSIWDIINKCSLTQDEEYSLKKYADELGVIYLSTPFSRKAAEFLNEIGVCAFKIGSGESDNIPLIRCIAKFRKPIILSTGMQSLNGITDAVEIIRGEGNPFALLECTNIYPSPPEMVSLKGIKELDAAYPDAVIGYSDHSIGPEMALASVSLGASIIERHFTDDRYRVGPDIICSMDPAELRIIIDRSKEIHKAIQNPKKRSDEEELVYKFARASVVAEFDLPAGHVLSEKDVWVRRPGNGDIPAKDYDAVIGKVLGRSVCKNEQLKWSYFV